MATAIDNARVVGRIVAAAKDDVGVGASDPKVNIDLKAEVALTDGVGNDQVNKFYGPVERTLAAGASEDLDLNATLVDFFGNTVSPTAIKGVMVVADSTNQANIEVGGASANAWTGLFKDATDIIVLPAGAFFCAGCPVAGWSLTAGTADLLQINNTDGSNAAKYQIVFLGA